LAGSFPAISIEASVITKIVRGHLVCVIALAMLTHLIAGALGGIMIP
jgi:hypothetical protein